MTSPDEIARHAAHLLVDGDAPAAVAALEKGLSHWPRSDQLRLAYAEALAAAGRGGEARSEIARTIAGPGVAAALQRLDPILRAAPPSPDEAAVLIDAVLAADAPVGLKHVAYDAIVRAGPDTEETARLGLLAQKTALHRYEWRYAVKLTEETRFEEALAVLRASHEAGRRTHPSMMLVADVLMVLGRHDEAVEAVREVLRGEPDRADVHRKLLLALHRRRDYAGAVAELEASLRRWPDDWLLVQRLSRLPMAPDTLRHCVDLLHEEAARDPRFRLYFGLARLAVRDYAGALRHLDPSFEWALERLAGPIRQILHSRPLDFWERNRGLDDDRRKDVQFARRADAVATVIVPCHVTFGLLPVEMLDALLAEANVNAIYLRDPHSATFSRGVRSLAPDLAGTATALREMADEMGAGRVITLGCSIGGFAAHLLGAEMNADVAVSFAGPIRLDTFHGDARPVIWNQLFFDGQAVLREPGLVLDVRPRMQAATRTRFMHFYGGQSAGDVTQAQLLKDMPQVEVTSDPDVKDHLVVSHMIADGRFHRLLADLTGTMQPA